MKEEYMTTKIINIKNSKALKVLKRLKDIDFIELLDKDKVFYLKNLKPKNESQEDKFLDLAGIWKGRDTTIQQLREKAWPQRK